MVPLPANDVLMSNTQATAKAATDVVSTTTSTPSAPATANNEKTAHDVLAGAMARAASQSTIHPLDTMKVRMQAGHAGHSPTAGSSRNFRVHAAGLEASSPMTTLRRGLQEVASLYKGVLGAASGAGIIIGAYFAFYSTTKKYLKEHTELPEGTVAFVSGATAAVGSSVVKVPIAVCIRSVQAGVYKNAFHAVTSIHQAVGWRGFFTGFLPTLLEDVPDMAVKFAVYETLRAVHRQLHDGEKPSILQDLFMGGLAGAAAAAATTPLDVVKTRMMCSASSRPTIVSAVKSVVAEGKGLPAFFRGVGPRALSNGLNSAIFFCFFEAIRRVLTTAQQQAEVEAALQASYATAAAPPPSSSQASSQDSMPASSAPAAKLAHTAAQRQSSSRNSRLACLSLAVPLHFTTQNCRVA